MSKYHYCWKSHVAAWEGNIPITFHFILICMTESSPSTHSKQLGKCIVIKGAKIRNRYNSVPRLTQDTNGKVTNSQLDTINESQEVSPFPAGDDIPHS